MRAKYYTTYHIQHPHGNTSWGSTKQFLDEGHETLAQARRAAASRPSSNYEVIVIYVDDDDRMHHISAHWAD